MATVNLTRLKRLADIALAYARSSSFSQAVRDDFLAAGQSLRDDLANATEAAWQAADAELDDLNAGIETAIQAISDEQNIENSYAATIATVVKVVNIVDKIINPV